MHAGTLRVPEGSRAENLSGREGCWSETQSVSTVRSQAKPGNENATNLTLQSQFFRGSLLQAATVVGKL